MIDVVLTLNPIKKVVYGRDPHFIHALEVIRAVWPDANGLAPFLWNHSAMLLRPEAIVARRSRAIFPMLRAHGLVPVSVRRIHLTPQQALLMWRYQANVMTQGHRRLLQRLLSAGPSIYILLKDHTHRKLTPATGHLTYLKGPTLMRKRSRRHLRSLAGPPIATILSYIHASDDPADLIRELAVLFSRNSFLDLLREAAAGQDRTSEALAALQQAELYAPKDVLSVPPTPRIEVCSSLEENCGLRREWMAICQQAQNNVSYVGGEMYETCIALVPDDKKYLAHLDDNVVFLDIGLGF